MPTIRPFRALRYDPAQVGDLARVVSPPSDSLSEEVRLELLARHPRNVVRLEAPPAISGEDPDERFRRASHTLGEWRTDGTLHRERLPSVYVYEQVSGEARRRGFFARLRLEQPASRPRRGTNSAKPGIHLATQPADGPEREERYRLLRATSAAAAPVVAVIPDADGRLEGVLDGVAQRHPDVEIDLDRIVHRAWVVPAIEPGSGEPDAGLADELMSGAAGSRIEIATDPNRYLAALRQAVERRVTRSGEDDPSYDYVLALFVPGKPPPAFVPAGIVIDPHEW